MDGGGSSMILPDHDRVGCHPAWQIREGTTVAFEVQDFDEACAKLKTAESPSISKNRDAGLLDGAISRSRRKQAGDSQEKTTKHECRMKEARMPK
jgi:hypothetical protein